jgi:hypothetical protein
MRSQTTMAASPQCSLRAAMIYCVVPEALADELYDKLVDYYKDDPNVKVIIDRRSNDRRKERDRRGERRDDDAPVEAEDLPRRTIRDRRNRRAPGSFPPLRGD